MKLTVFNGSPRGKGSGTKIMMDAFLEGFSKAGNSFEVYYVKQMQDESGQACSLMKECDCACLAFPLYTDIVPGIVKKFVEHLEPLRGQLTSLKMLYLVQSGFPEAAHSRYAERYLEHLSAILGAEYLGTMIKGGIEGIGKRPASYDRAALEGMKQLGDHFGRHGTLDERMLTRLARPEKLSVAGRMLLPLVAKFINNPMYWDKMMKDNSAYEKRFARPYSS